MAIGTTQPSQVFKIIQSDSNDIQLGEIIYYQPDQFGSPVGLLLALTKNITLVKMIKTSNGLQRINI